jgi:predicted amidohydrolase YtcJ
VKHLLTFGTAAVPSDAGERVMEPGEKRPDTGSLETGKRAELAFLDRDAFTVPPAEARVVA